MLSAKPKLGNPRRNSLLLLLVLVCGAAASGPASAAVFCLGLPGVGGLQCIYDDLQLCRRDAASQRGYCTVNLKEFPNLPRYGSVCLVDNNRNVACPYQDFASCQVEARRGNSVCFFKPNQKDPKKPAPSPLDPTLTDLARSALVQPPQ